MVAPAPLSSADPARLRSVRLVASDVDGTLTAGGRIASTTVAVLEELAGAGLLVLLVTGRSAGWGAALAAYTPGIAGLVAENGAVLCLPGPDTAPLVFEGLPGPAAVGSMEEAVAEVLATYSGARPGADNFCRLTDRTVAAAPALDPGVVGAIAHRHGLRHTHSTVHHHLSSSGLDKRSGVLRAMAQVAPDLEPARHVLTVGDSPNDEPLFARDAFSLSVGVAHLAARNMAVPPEFLTAAENSEGFAEIAAALLSARRARPPGPGA